MPVVTGGLHHVGTGTEPLGFSFWRLDVRPRGARPSSYRTTCRKCRRANSRPEPVFKYRSNSIAGASSSNSITTSVLQGRWRAVCGDNPSLCAASLARGSDVMPT